MSHGTDMGDGQRIAEEAAAWLARLDGEACSGAELAAFERWRGADPLHAIAYRQAEHMWRDSSAVIGDSLALSEASRQALRPPAREGARRRWRFVPALAATLATVAVAGMLYWNAPQPSQPPVGTRHATAVGEQRDVVFADGSALTLDTQSVVVERYGPGERRVDLRQGQVQFDVQGDPARPFVVHAGNGTITAVGTRFQVRVVDTGTTVTLLQGSVHVAARAMDGSPRVDALQPGQRIGFDAEGRLGDVETADLRAVEGWMQGKLYVDDWTLRDFVDELNRYSATQLRIDGPELERIRLSGVFQTRDRDNLERLLEQGWGIHARQVAQNEVVLSRR